jgi:hypothetical protein
VRWMVLNDQPDCIVFFQRMLDIRWGHLGDFTSLDGEAAKHLLMTHFRVISRLTSTTIWGGFYKNPPRRTETSLWRLSAKLAIDGFVTFKAAREDEIFPGLLQHGIEIIIGHIMSPLLWNMVVMWFCCKKASL